MSLNQDSTYSINYIPLNYRSLEPTNLKLFHEFQFPSLLRTKDYAVLDGHAQIDPRARPRCTAPRDVNEGEIKHTIVTYIQQNGADNDIQWFLMQCNTCLDM